MPASEYASVGGGLRLKGAKVEKKKKRDKKDRRDKDKHKGKDKHGQDRAARAVEAAVQALDEGAGSEAGTDDPYARMTPAERRFAEAQDKKIRQLMHATPEEVKAARPDLFKSHREKVAELNSYLSRLSEHNDMPKIGPG